MFSRWLSTITCSMLIFKIFILNLNNYNFSSINYINSTNPVNYQLISDSIGPRVDDASSNEQSEVRQDQQAQERPRDQAPRAERNQANNDADREDDWLGTLHNLVSFFILLSIVYYYSSLERFLFIFIIAIILIW